MYPPSQNLDLDITAVSGICGSVSLACWIVVFSPQIVENFRRSSAEGLSTFFVIIWLTGDVFNVLGSVLQGVLPTMIILAVYYMLADIVLLSQCFYYKGFKFTEEVKPAREPERDGERRPLLSTVNGNGRDVDRDGRRQSTTSLREHLHTLSEASAHLSPAVPLHPDRPIQRPAARSMWQSIIFNTASIIVVCAAGVLGWYLSNRHSTPQGGGGSPEKEQETLEFNVAGQIFGYICAAFYLGSRVPQLLLNYRRKSTEGISVLFFLFACVGNLTYVLSIFAYAPVCKVPTACEPGEASAIYARYIAVNSPWLLGSMGTLLLDFVVLGQFFVFGQEDADEDEDFTAQPVRQ